MKRSKLCIRLIWVYYYEQWLSSALSIIYRTAAFDDFIAYGFLREPLLNTIRVI